MSPAHLRDQGSVPGAVTWLRDGRGGPVCTPDLRLRLTLTEPVSPGEAVFSTSGIGPSA